MKSFEVTVIGKPDPWLIEAAASVGLDFAGLTHEVTDHFKNHVKKRHGKGSLTILDTDFNRITRYCEIPGYGDNRHYSGRGIGKRLRKKGGWGNLCILMKYWIVPGTRRCGAGRFTK